MILFRLFLFGIITALPCEAATSRQPFNSFPEHPHCIDDIPEFCARMVANTIAHGHGSPPHQFPASVPASHYDSDNEELPGDFYRSHEKIHGYDYYSDFMPVINAMLIKSMYDVVVDTYYDYRRDRNNIKFFANFGRSFIYLKNHLFFSYERILTEFTAVIKLLQSGWVKQPKEEVEHGIYYCVLLHPEPMFLENTSLMSRLITACGYKSYVDTRCSLLLFAWKSPLKLRIKKTIFNDLCATLKLQVSYLDAAGGGAGAGCAVGEP